MILDRISLLDRYTSLHPRFSKAFAFAEKLIANPPVDGRYVMPNCDVPDAVYINVCSYTTKPLDNDSRMETHKTYADIQIMIEGTEIMYTPATDALTETQPYNSEKDYTLYAMPDMKNCAALTVPAGSFAVFFPGEAHAPSKCVGGVCKPVRKLIVKVLF